MLLLFSHKTIEIVLPELQEMRTAHLVSIGSETMCSLNPDYEDGYESMFSGRNFLLSSILLVFSYYVIHSLAYSHNV